MAMVVKNNMAAVSTLNTLNRNSGALQKSLAKVSSGMRINSAQDDASGYAISERMRVQIRALDQANQNTQNGSSMMKTAEGAVASTVEILKTLKEKAINAATDTNTDADRQTIQKEVNQFIDQIDDNALVTFNGKYLVEGSKTQSGNATKTAFTNQSLGLYEYGKGAETDDPKELTGKSALTALTNRKGESLEITTSDKVTASFVKDGHTYSTTFDVGDKKLEDIFTNLNETYTKATGDTAFGPPNQDTTLTVTGDVVENATTVANSLLDENDTEADEAVGVYAVLGDTGSVSQTGGLTVDGEGNASTDYSKLDALKQSLALMAAYDEEGETVSSFSDSVAAKNYAAQTDAMVTALSAKFGEATSVSINGEAVADVSSAAEGVVTALEKAATDYLESYTSDDLSLSGYYEAVTGVLGSVAYGDGQDDVALVPSDANGKITGETGDIDTSYKSFANAFLISYAAGGFSEKGGEDYDKALSDAKDTKSAWAKAASTAQAPDTSVEKSYNATEIAAAVAKAQGVIDSVENAGIITALAKGEDISDMEGAANVYNALAVLDHYTAAGATGEGVAESNYSTIKEGIENNLTSYLENALSTSSESYGKAMGVTVAENATNNETVLTLESDWDSNTASGTVISNLVSAMESAALSYSKGNTSVKVGNGSADANVTTAALAADKVLGTAKLYHGDSDYIGGAALTADNVSSAGVTTATFADALLVKTLVTNASTALADINAADALASFMEDEEEGGGLMVSGMEMTSGDATGTTTATDEEEEEELVLRDSDIGLSASGKTVSTADGEIGFTVTAANDSLAGQISGLTISVANSEGQVKKTTNEFLNAFTTTIFAANESEDYSLKLHVGANANQSISVGLQDMRAEALGLKGSDGTVIDISTQERANAAIAAFDNALQKALDQQTTIGAVEARLEYTSSNLTTSAENTQAAESAIRDADMAKEMTNYTKNNVLLQAAQSMLAQANQNASAVLSLLQ